jgi:DNA-binding beta-propeller fold protein YncE
VTSEFGRPQGLAYRHDKLYVVDAAVGWNGVYRILPSGMTEPFVSGTNLIGLAFDPGGGFVVSSNDTAYRFSSGFRL